MTERLTYPVLRRNLFGGGILLNISKIVCVLYNQNDMFPLFTSYRRMWGSCVLSNH